MAASLYEEAVEGDESLECDAPIVEPVWTVLLHHSLPTIS